MLYKNIMIHALFIVSALFAGYLFGSAQTERRGETVETKGRHFQPEALHLQDSGPTDLSILRLEIRSILREELQNLMASPLRASEPDPEEEETALTRETIQQELAQKRQTAYTDGHKILEDSLGIGVWRKEDSHEFRSRVALMSMEEQNHLIGQLFTAIREGRLKLETEGPPL